MGLGHQIQQDDFTDPLGLQAGLNGLRGAIMPVAIAGKENDDLGILELMGYFPPIQDWHVNRGSCGENGLFFGTRINNMPGLNIF